MAMVKDDLLEFPEDIRSKEDRVQRFTEIRSVNDQLKTKPKNVQHAHCQTTEELLLSRFCHDYSSLAGGYDDLVSQNANLHDDCLGGHYV